MANSEKAPPSGYSRTQKWPSIMDRQRFSLTGPVVRFSLMRGFCQQLSEHASWGKDSVRNRFDMFINRLHWVQHDVLPDDWWDKVLEGNDGLVPGHKGYFEEPRLRRNDYCLLDTSFLNLEPYGNPKKLFAKLVIALVQETSLASLSLIRLLWERVKLSCSHRENRKRFGCWIYALHQQTSLFVHEFHVHSSDFTGSKSVNRLWNSFKRFIKDY